MRNNEGIHREMNAVAFYSNTGQSKRIAEYFSVQLGYPLVDIVGNECFHYENLVLVFPVYCQNVPAAVRNFLNRSESENLIVIATYGRMCPGNVIYEIQKNYRKNIVAAAYLPTKHTYVENDKEFFDFDKLKPIIEKLAEPKPIELPKLYKNPLADLFPNVRGRLGVRIINSSSCIGCGICTDSCSSGAMNSGVTNKNCIRCLKCVRACPRNALRAKIRLPLRIYLKKKKTERVIIYV